MAGGRLQAGQGWRGPPSSVDGHRMSLSILAWLVLGKSSTHLTCRGHCKSKGLNSICQRYRCHALRLQPCPSLSRYQSHWLKGSSRTCSPLKNLKSFARTELDGQMSCALMCRESLDLNIGCATLACPTSTGSIFFVHRGANTRIYGT
ncbi:uncharacterized protein VTP21DRAFT_10404 [Calcarisporiella thermophila]|uniref:uncharacterized protein n=1 Tax=Calcarisporiella thermophila TaxID=911321 RepID=UPI0037437C60